MTAEELCCALILAFFAIQGAIPFIAPNHAPEASGLPTTRLMFYGGVGSQLVVYAAIAYLLLRQAAGIMRRLRAMQWTLGIALLAIASTFWSQFPAYTVRRSVPFAMAGLFGLYLATRYPVRRQLAILRVTMLTLAAASIALALAFPRLGLDYSTGHHADWQGVFTQKNTCGEMMVLATAILLAGWKPTWQRIASAALFLGVLFMTGSRSAWLLEAAVVLLWAALTAARRVDAPTRILAALAALFGLPATAVALFWWRGPLLAWLGRGPTLSGRTLIWQQVWVFIQQRPWLGWGYEAFWRGMRGQAFRIDAALNFVVFHAHNGFLEIWLNLGLAGLALFVLSYARAWRGLWPTLRAGQVERVLWPVLVLSLVLLYNLDENTLLTYNGIFWVLYVMAVANIELLRAEDRLQSEVARRRQRRSYATGPALP
ncbi:MAG TPA: O-antigen ligase family protein [Acidobacteriaceae bacterium]|nr:O-antigen ligase family protein [Acidobacteriaceae bacterium]